MPIIKFKLKYLPKNIGGVHIKTRGRIICFCASACQIYQHNILCFNLVCDRITGYPRLNLLARRLLK